MRRATLNEKQRTVALLVSLGQFDYKHIAQQAKVHRNSISNWLRDERFQALVAEFQQHIQHRLADMAIVSTHRKHSPLIVKAIDKLEQMLEAKSPQRQLEAIQFLLQGPIPHQNTQDVSQGEQLSPLRVSEEIRVQLQTKQW